MKLWRFLRLVRGFLRCYGIGAFCPECNSDAPRLYDCPVCEYYTEPYPATFDTRAEWWRRFTTRLEDSNGNTCRQGP